jgi:hypothetical protein
VRADPTNALHRASFYLEEAKYGAGPDLIIEQTMEMVLAFNAALLEAAGLSDTITPEELIDACHYYAHSYSNNLLMPCLIANSIFTDGVQHGIALARGLELPNNPREGMVI